jgi:hypothetical protein
LQDGWQTVFRCCSGRLCKCRRMFMKLKLKLLLPVAAVLLVSGCASSSSSSSTSSTASGGVGAQAGGGALAADARSAATGDIPDTQNFLTLAAAHLRISMLYPEGWAVQEAASRVSITDKNNLVRILLSSGPRPSIASVQAQLAVLRRSAPTLTSGAPHAVALKSGAALKVTYTTLSAPNPVTGKQVKLMVDRYVLWHGGRVAVVDLGTPVGVDNVDAYRRMIESFRWK